MPFYSNDQNAYGKVRGASSSKKAKEKRYAKGKSKANDRIVKVTIICDHSENIPELYFDNKVSAKDLRNVKRTQIHNILKLHDKTMKFANLPLEPKGDTLEKNKNNPGRIGKILDLYGITFVEDYIEKCKFITKDSNGRTLSTPTINFDGDLLRFFVIFGNSEVKVVLIDPHHQVATEKYVKRYNENIDKCKFCLSYLKDI